MNGARGMSYIDAGASIFEWFPHRPSAAKLHPAMWLTPLRGLSLVLPLSERAHTRLQSDDVEMEGSTPEVFPGTDCGGPTGLAVPPVASVGIYHANERAMPTPPVSPASNRNSMVSSAGGSPQHLSRSLQHLSLSRDAHIVSSNPFPRSSSLARAAHVPTAPGAPKRRGRVGRSPTGPVPQPPVAPGSDADAQARSLSPLAPRVWSPKPARKDPLSDWGYTNPKPPSPTTPAGLQMDVGAFPTASAAAVYPREAMAKTTPKPVSATAATAVAAPSAGRPCSRPVYPVMSPEQRAQAKLMLEGRIVYCRDGDGGAPVPARSMALTTIVVSTPVPTAAASADMAMGLTSSRPTTDPETDVDDAECPKPLSVTASSYGESTYALPGLAADDGNTVAAADDDDPELGLGMFDWDYSLTTAPDNVPRVPDIPVAPTPVAIPVVADGARVVSGSRYRDGFGYGYGDMSVGTDGSGAASVPSAATQQQQQRQRRRLEDVAAVPAHDVEETAWGYRVPDADHYVDHYSVSATSLGWDGCYYGSGMMSYSWSSGSTSGSTSPTALEAAVSAATVRGDANLSMGIIYDLV